MERALWLFDSDVRGLELEVGRKSYRVRRRGKGDRILQVVGGGQVRLGFGEGAS